MKAEWAGAGVPARAGHGGDRQHGFTLLEVMVALTITGIALGGLFSVIAGNKQLAWRSEDALVRTSQLRNLINFSQLNDEQGEAYAELEENRYILIIDEELEIPERKTRASQFALRKYELLDEYGDLITSGSYWVELDLPE